MGRSTFRVLWTEAATSDLEDIIAYVATDSVLYALRLHARLKKGASSLETAPLRGRVVPELAHFGIRTWRELLLKPYRIVYRVAEDTVYVLAVLDSRRDLQDLLLERLLRQS